MEGVKAYTDASVDLRKVRTGIGISAPEIEIEYAGFASKTMSSFKGELLAVNRLFSECINKNISDISLNVISDSESALKALQNKRCNSKIQAGIKRQIAELETRNVNVSFLWIPAHTGFRNEFFDGNDRADALTRDPGAHHSMLLDTAPKTRRELKQQMRTEMIQNEKWPASTHQVSKAFKIDKLLQQGKDLTSFNRRDFTLLLRFMTGFSCLAQHMKYVIDLTNTRCRFCNETESLDSSKHIIEECMKFNTARLRHFGKLNINLQEEQLDSSDILSFIKSTPSLVVRLMTWTDTALEATEIHENRQQISQQTLTQRIHTRNLMLQAGNSHHPNINSF